MPLFSIIIPIYKVEKYLDECLKSIMSQSFGDYEVIMVDDGSPDSCPKICNECAAKDSRFKAVHKQNGGLVSARKAGLQASSGKYILNVDGDDYIAPGLLNKLAGIIKSNPDVDIIAFDYQNVSDNGDAGNIIRNEAEEGLLDKEAIKALLGKTLYDFEKSFFNAGWVIYSVWSKAIKREIAKEYQMLVPNSLTNGEDVAVVIPAVYAANLIYVSHYAGYYYRTRSDSIMNSFSKKDIISYEGLIRFLQGKVNEDNLNGYSAKVLVSHLAKAARSFHSLEEYKLYCNEIYNGIWSERLKNLKKDKLRFQKRMLVSAIKNKMWIVPWLIYGKIRRA